MDNYIVLVSPFTWSHILKGRNWLYSECKKKIKYKVEVSTYIQDNTFVYLNP